MTTEAQAIPQAAPRGLGAARPRWGERIVEGVLFLCALLSVAITVGIVVALFEPLIDFFENVDFVKFLTGTDWSPLFEPPSFGVRPLLVGTLVTTFWALVVCVPFGLGAAIWLSEYARPRARAFLKPTLEVLAGVPTVVYGFFALTFVTPLLQDIWPGFLGDPPAVFNALAAGLVIGIMILPTVASLSEDAMSAVPGGLREGALALGGSRMQVATRVVVPAALSGIVASFVLAISRAVGETMIVLIASGLIANNSLNPTQAHQTMTGFIGQAGIGDLSTGSIGYQTIFAVGATLFVITFVMNMFSIRLVRKYREVYE